MLPEVCLSLPIHFEVDERIFSESTSPVFIPSENDFSLGLVRFAGPLETASQSVDISHANDTRSVHEASTQRKRVQAICSFSRGKVETYPVPWHSITYFVSFS